MTVTALFLASCYILIGIQLYSSNQYAYGQSSSFLFYREKNPRCSGGIEGGDQWKRTNRISYLRCEIRFFGLKDFGRVMGPRIGRILILFRAHFQVGPFPPDVRMNLF